jgi:hypothetical protein
VQPLGQFYRFFNVDPHRWPRGRRCARDVAQRGSIRDSHRGRLGVRPGPRTGSGISRLVPLVAPSYRSAVSTEPLAERVEQVARSHFPYARCFACIAHDFDVTEVEVRSSAHMLVVADRFRLVRRICYGCSRAVDTLMPHADLEA